MKHWTELSSIGIGKAKREPVRDAYDFQVEKLSKPLDTCVRSAGERSGIYVDTYKVFNAIKLNESIRVEKA